MHDEDMAQETSAVLGLLLSEVGPWAVYEIEREIGDRVAAADAVACLVDSGLAHRIDRAFIVASRAARMATALLP